MWFAKKLGITIRITTLLSFNFLFLVVFRDRKYVGYAHFCAAAHQRRPWIQTSTKFARLL
jgi:hypothetical protein